MDLSDLIKTLSDVLRTKQLKLATAESCTGGLIAMLITELSGSSGIFDRGFVTYSNQSKIDMLGVNSITLDNHGAVSMEVATEMAMGALKTRKPILPFRLPVSPARQADRKPNLWDWSISVLPAKTEKPTSKNIFFPVTGIQSATQPPKPLWKRFWVKSGNKKDYGCKITRADTLTLTVDFPGSATGALIASDATDIISIFAMPRIIGIGDGI